MGRKDKNDSKSMLYVKKPQNFSEISLTDNELQVDASVNESINETTMDEAQSPTKAANVKKVAPPVESSINQRPRRKIKHKFIKCNRESPEKTNDTEINIENAVPMSVKIELEDLQPSTSQANKPKTKNQQKTAAEKKIRRSGRQGRSKESMSVDLDDSNLQMVEIIDDPSDDPNVSIEEIIETCVLGAEEYERMINCSPQVGNDSSSNTATSVAEQSDASVVSVERTSLNSQSSTQGPCEKQFYVELVDCMKNKRFSLDKEDVINKDNTFEGVFSKPTGDTELKENEKVDIKPTVEFCSPIRTRRVTRLSTMTSYRPPDVKSSSPKHSSPKCRIDAVQLSKVSKKSDEQQDQQIDAEVKKPEASEEILADIKPQSEHIELSGDKFEDEQDDGDVSVSTDLEPNKVEIEEASNEIIEGELTDMVEISGDTIENEQKVNLDTTVVIDESPVSKDLSLETSPTKTHRDGSLESQVLEHESVENVEVKTECLIKHVKPKEKTKSRKDKKRSSEKPQNTNESQLTPPEEKSQPSPATVNSESELEDQEKTKSKKDKKRSSEKLDVQDSNESQLTPPEEKSQPSPATVKSESELENQSTEQNKSDFITFMEEKFRSSDPTMQIQQAIDAESEDSVRKQEKIKSSDMTMPIQQADSEDSVRKQEGPGEIVKIEKTKSKKESHSDKSSKDKSKRSSESGKKLDKSVETHSSHSKDKHAKAELKSSSKSSSSDKRSKDSKDSKSSESKVKQQSTEQISQTKKSLKKDSTSNRSEKDIAMEQLKELEQKTVHSKKSTSQSHKESSEKSRDSSGKTKIKSTTLATKVKSKTKETAPHETKDDKSNAKEQGSTSRKIQQATPTIRPSNKSNRCGTDFILSECYLPKQVKYDESLYSIEALKAAQAAQEEQMKVDAEIARKAREILAAKEEQIKAARAAARLAKIEEAKAAEKAKLAEEAEADKAAKLAAKAAAKLARVKQAKENSNKFNDSPQFDNFGLFTAKEDSQEPPISSPQITKHREASNQDFIPENFKNSPGFVHYQGLGQIQNEQNAQDFNIKTEETVAPVDEEETNIRRSGRIKTITETKQRACGFGLVKDRDRFHNMYAGDLSYSSMSDSQYMSDYNSSNSNSMLDLSEIEKDTEMETVVVRKEKTDEELEQERRDVAEGLGLFKQIIDCEYRTHKEISKETKKMTCDCFLTKSEMERGELGCGEDCLNRLIFIECGSRCAVGDRCTNKRFQKHQNSDCTIFKAGKKGFGLRASSIIDAGDFIMEYVGEVLNSKQFDDRRFKYSKDNIQHHYFMALRSDCVIDATIKGNISRFINHSCDPNAETQKWTVNGELRIGFFSTRTIQPDEEITFDYQFQRYGKEAQKCYCDAANCRGWIGEEPDSEEEEEYEDEEEGEEEEEDELGEEEEVEQIEEEQITPAVTEIPKPEATGDENLVEPALVAQETDDSLKKSDKLVVKSTTPSPTKKIRKPKPDQKPKKFKIKKSEIMEDPDLDHEIANLMESNLKNQAHTLRFSRLMVRAKMLNGRSKLLSILRNGELACRRLFLDYHGLKLLHTWMCDPVTNNIQQEWAFRLDILETLEVLPIPNKNMLQDSKVLVTVQKWANTKGMKENVKSPEESPSDSGSGTPIFEGNSPKVDDAKNVDSLKTESKSCEMEQTKETVDSLREEEVPKKEVIDPTTKIIDSTKEVLDSMNEVIDTSKNVDSPKEVIDSLKEVSELPREITDSEDRNNTGTAQLQSKTGEECADDELMEQIRFMTSRLLESWEQLKEVFRIPKKLRIEQMKEHEQEANRSYRAFGITDGTDSTKRYSDPSRDRERDKERYKKEKWNRSKEATDPDSMMLKVQRRRLFEAQVAQESADKRNTERQMQIEAIHVAKCKYFQLDPRVTSYRDMPFSVSPLTGQWYSQDGQMIPTPPSHAHIKPPQELPTNPDEYDLPPMDLPDQWKFAIDTKGRLYYYHVKIRIPQWDPPIKILPLREEQTPHIDDVKMEFSDDNETDGKDESLINSNISHELDSEKEDDSDLESSDAIDSSEDELMQKRQQLLNCFQANQTDLDISANLAVEISAMATTSTLDESTDQSFNLENSLVHSLSKKKNRDGLATERLISPRTDEERLQSKIEMQRYKANKEKLRRRRENAKLRQHSSSEPSRKLKKLTEGLPVVSQEDDIDETDDEDEVNVSDLDVGVLNAKFVDELDGMKVDKMPNRPELLKVRPESIRPNRKVPKRKRNEPEPVPHNSTEAAKRIKEKFCAEMSGVIVQHLGPYRKDECKIGRITNNDDFKHLARKLTHFVMLKELKHCDNTVTVLEVTDSVRSKSKEFIRKYMAKFGDVYVKPENEPEYKEFCNT